MRRLPWILFGTAALLSATGVVLLAQAPSEVLERADNSFVLSALFAAILLVFGLVGALVASRLPSNPIGWLFIALALIEGVYELAFGYTHYTLHAEPGSLPGAEWAAWVSNWTSPLSPVFIVAALLLFPDGRPPTPRWRWVLWLCIPQVALTLMQYALAPGPIDEFPSLDNPVGLDGAPWLADINSEPFISVLVIAAAAALVVRFRRSHGVERQQVKWFAFAAGLMAAFLIVGGLVQSLVSDENSDDSIAAGFVFAAFISGVPISAGIAILRHRLYDIDVVINRTLVYGVADRDARRDLPGARAARRARRRRVELRGRGVDARGRGAVPAAAHPDPGAPSTTASTAAATTRAHARGVRRAAARRARPRDARRGRPRRRAGHRAARPRVAVAQERADEARGGLDAAGDLRRARRRARWR